MKFTVFAKAPGAELMRFEATAECHAEAITLVKEQMPGSTVLADLSLTTPTESAA